MTRTRALARLDAEAVHLRARLRAGAGRAGDADRGPAGRFRRLPAAQFRHELPGRRQRAPGAAAVAQRAGGPPARRGRAGAADGALPPGRRRRRRCRRARRRAWPSASAASASRCATSSSSTPALPMAASAKVLRDGIEAARRRRSPTAPMLEAAGRLADRRHPVRRQAAAKAPPGAASPTRPAPPTATATPGRSATTAAMCSASGSAGRMPARCPACPATSRPHPSCSRPFPAPACAAMPLAAAAGRHVAHRPRRPAGDARTLRLRQRPAARLRTAATEPAPQIVFPPDGARVELGAASDRRCAAGAQAAGRPRAVPLARQRQAAARHRAPPHRHLAARRRRLFDADGDRRGRPGGKREGLRGVNSTTQLRRTARPNANLRRI